MDKQTIIDNARKTCVAAREATPEPLRGFIVDLPQAKNLSHNPNVKDYVNFEVPYMSVDGRVAWAQQEAKAEGKDIFIQTSFEQVAEKWVCTATVRAPRGTSTGHSIVNIGGSGVDAK